MSQLQQQKHKAAIMPVYNIDLAKRLVDAAGHLEINNTNDNETGRAIAYISLLAIEIALKCGLEKSGTDVSIIKKTGHDISELLDMLSIQPTQISHDTTHERIKGSIIRSIVVDNNYSNATIGNIISNCSTEHANVSKYPNEIRYGDSIKHFLPSLLRRTAECTINEICKYWNLGTN